MAGKPKPARVVRWNDGDYYLFFRDFATGKQVRRKCTALGAHTHLQRKELEKQYRAKEFNQQIEVAQAGGRVDGNSRLVDDLDLYLQDCTERAKVRAANPKARLGISDRTAEIIAHNVGHFRAWLESARLAGIRTKDLDPRILQRYVNFVATEGTLLGERKTLRTSSTINQYKRNLKTCVRWISHLKPRRILDRDELMDALRAERTSSSRQPVAYSPSSLADFLSIALERESEDRKAEVARVKNGKLEQFQQAAPSSAATPVSRLFLLLALTGCRRGEALAMQWKQVDLERGRVTILAAKTGMMRWVPLTKAAEGEIAPTFCRLLRKWREEDPYRVYVLPHEGLPAPVFPKGAWHQVNLQLEGIRIGPQNLRQNFTSYAASLGIPPAVTAMWQGHSAEVAERHYRAQVLDRIQNAASFEEAMGLRHQLETMLP